MQTPSEIVRSFDFGKSSAVLGPAVMLTDMASPGRVLYGPEAVATYLSGLRLAFAESRIEEKRHSVSGEIVTQEFLFRGIRQVADVGAIAPRAKNLCLPMCAIYRVAHGMITEITLYYNARSIAIQLHG